MDDSVFGQLMSEAGSPCLLEQLGESVTHYPQPVVTNGVLTTTGVTVKAIVVLNEISTQEDLPESPQDRRQLYSGTLQMSSDVTVTDDKPQAQCDLFFVRGLMYRVVVSDGDAPLQTVAIRRVDKVLTRQPRAVQ